ncbi:MAG: heavy-metal-associated domain-containing protein [Streptomyces sp.]|uniref:heavy-metal-associated domain-containing protein n=1 Tax=Streptomyces sp. TaxID=1931 RepID=UPI003D6B0656
MTENPATTSCCTTDGSCDSSAGSSDTAASSTVYAVTGMTCGHCVSSVTKALDGLDGVSDVKVDLDAGRVTVTSDTDLDDVIVAEVIDDAGYELAGRV